MAGMWLETHTAIFVRFMTIFPVWLPPHAKTPEPSFV